MMRRRTATGVCGSDHPGTGFKLKRPASAILLLHLLATSTLVAAAGPEAFLVRRHAPWRYFAGQQPPPEDWNLASLDDTRWKLGPVGIGYGDRDDRTVLDDMRGRYRSVWIRKCFDLESTDGLESLYLYLRFDDGFIAYINGTPVASAGVIRTDGRLRVELHEAEGYEEFVIEEAARVLRPGTNVIAIEGHNAALNSSDFSLDPVLTLRRLDPADGLIAADDYLHDLDFFGRRLVDDSSYLTRRGFDYEAELSRIRESVDEETSIAGFAADLHKLVMQIGDCHAWVSSDTWPGSDQYLPLRPADTVSGIAALGISRDKPLHSEYPYIESIDGIPLDRWMTAASMYVPRGSPQLIRRESLWWLGQIALIRRDLGLPAKETVTIGLRGSDGSNRVEKRLRLTRQRYSVARVPIAASRRINDEIGYLRIARMDDRVVQPTVGQIRSFRDTDGMIIDVRDNGGGTYSVLRAVYGFFVPEAARPYVTNVAAYRLSRRFSEDHLAYRPTYRADWKGWSDVERAAIRDAAASFTPHWMPPEGMFSQWHYMVLSRQRSGRAVGDYFYYDRPVILLTNAGSFSATDGFISALADLPQVTVLGEPSGGGSGSKRGFTLPRTGLRVTLSSMASFRNNGQLFDGNGVEVDVRATPTLEDFTNGTDSVLERAVSLITEKARR